MSSIAAPPSHSTAPVPSVTDSFEMADFLSVTSAPTVLEDFVPTRFTQDLISDYCPLIPLANRVVAKETSHFLQNDTSVGLRIVGEANKFIAKKNMTYVEVHKVVEDLNQLITIYKRIRNDSNQVLSEGCKYVAAQACQALAGIYCKAPRSFRCEPLSQYQTKEEIAGHINKLSLKIQELYSDAVNFGDPNGTANYALGKILFQKAATAKKAGETEQSEAFINQAFALFKAAEQKGENLRGSRIFVDFLNNRTNFLDYDNKGKDYILKNAKNDYRFWSKLCEYLGDIKTQEHLLELAVSEKCTKGSTQKAYMKLGICKLKTKKFGEALNNLSGVVNSGLRLVNTCLARLQMHFDQNKESFNLTTHKTAAFWASEAVKLGSLDSDVRSIARAELIPVRSQPTDLARRMEVHTKRETRALEIDAHICFYGSSVVKKKKTRAILEYLFCELEALSEDIPNRKDGGTVASQEAALAVYNTLCLIKSKFRNIKVRYGRLKFFNTYCNQAGVQKKIKENLDHSVSDSNADGALRPYVRSEEMHLEGLAKEIVINTGSSAMSYRTPNATCSSLLRGARTQHSFTILHLQDRFRTYSKLCKKKNQPNKWQQNIHLSCLLTINANALLLTKKLDDPAQGDTALHGLEQMVCTETAYVKKKGESHETLSDIASFQAILSLVSYYSRHKNKDKETFYRARLEEYMQRVASPSASGTLLPPETIYTRLQETGFMPFSMAGLA